MTGSDKTITEIENMILKQLEKDIRTLHSLSKNPKVAAALAGTNSDSYNDNSNNNLSHSSAMKETSDRMLKYLIRKMTRDFPSIASTSYKLLEVPESLSQHLSPAFYLAPPIDDLDNNVIFLNNSCCINNENLFITLAHEGFPGHLYQTTYFAEKSPSLIRYIIDIGGYSEGWATYSELYAYNYLYKDTSIKKAMICNSRYSLSLYCLADIGINYHSWTLNDTIDFFKKYSIDDTKIINNIYDSMIATPANYLQYYVGYLEFLELKNYMKNKLGASYSPLVFHTFVLESGPAPFNILKKLLITETDTLTSGLHSVAK